MADIKLSQLGQITTLEDDDIILVSQDSGGGLFISKRISVSDLTTEIGGGGGGAAVATGIVQIWTTITPPLGYLECNGAAVGRTGFPDLFALIGVTYGAGNGSTTFNVPDYRGEFLRGWAHGTTNDPDKASRTNRGDGVTGDNIGTKQSSVFKAHLHGLFGTSKTGNHSGIGRVNGRAIGATSSEFEPQFRTILAGTGGDVMSTEGGSETRPRNVNVMYIIKT